MDSSELQGEPEEVAREKCKAAAKLYIGPVITEDVSFCMPGVYIRYFLECVGPEGINKMRVGFNDKRAYAQCIYAYCPGPDQEVQLFVGKCPGLVVSERGESQFGKVSFDAIFQPDEWNKTFAEMTKEEKNKISHRGLASVKMIEYFQKHK